MKKNLGTAVLFALGTLASLLGSLAQAQDDAAMQVFRKLLMEMESQSAQRTQSNANSNSATPAILNDNRSVTLGRSSTREAPPPPPVRVTKVYDLADLFAVAPSFEAKGWVGWDDSPLLHSTSSSASSSDIFGGGGGGMGGMMRVSQTSVKLNNGEWQPTPEKLIEAIESTVDAEWAVKGGKETLCWLGSSLLVTAYPETHAMVKQLLDLLQPRWNARVTLETRIHWLWLSFAEEEKLARLMVSSEASLVRSIETETLSKFISVLPQEESRPTAIHARLQSHNGQLVSWVSGEQRRSVVGWDRKKGKLIPTAAVAHRGVACEIITMLAHASDHATVVLNSRVVKACDTDEAPKINAEVPKPSTDPVCGQTVSSTVRVPIGRATVVGGGSSNESGLENWQLAVVVSVDLVSPRERVEK